MNESPQQGFTLLEMVCVLAIIALLAAVLLPVIPRETSRSRLQAYALQAAALLKMDRDAAIRRHINVATLTAETEMSSHPLGEVIFQVEGIDLHVLAEKVIDARLNDIWT